MQSEDRPDKSNAGRESTRAQADLKQIRREIARMGAMVTRQLESAMDAFTRFDLGLASSVIEKDDLVDHLNLRVEEDSYDLTCRVDSSEGDIRAARSALKVAANLERIGDAAAHIAKHVPLMVSNSIEPRPVNLDRMARLARQATREGTRAYLSENLSLAQRACEREPELDDMYTKGLNDICSIVEADPKAIGHSIHVLLVLKHLEKVGDFVLNIGEQAIYVTTGKRLKFTQFQQLDALLGSAESTHGFTAYLDGISGAVVARVRRSESPVLFKEGSRHKIEQEVEKSAEWRNIDEDLIPKVLSTASLNGRRSFLREYVEGMLLSQVYFEQGDPDLQEYATEQLCKTLSQIWRQTLRDEVPTLDYVKQVENRLDDVFTFHPNLQHLASAPLSYDGLECVPLDEQLDLARRLEPGLSPPVSIWLHGDFNPNNIIIEPTEGKLKFIDVHRSRHGDPLQDISVFLVGLKREPDISPTCQGQLVKVQERILEFVSDFAAEVKDHNWSQRLLLAMARSYITSARIILQPAHAEWLFHEGRLTLQRLIRDAKA